MHDGYREWPRNLPHHSFCTWRNVAVEFISENSLDGVAEQSRVLRWLIRRYPAGAALITVLSTELPRPPSADVRAALEAEIERYGSVFKAHAMVIEAVGFRGAIARAFHSALLLAARPNYARTTVASPYEAAHWVVGRMGLDRDPRAAASLASAVEQLRSSRLK